MITELTPEQERELPIWHKKYFDIGSSTEPLNKPELEKAIKAFYARINEKEPVFLYCESPMTAMLMLKAVLPKLAELTKNKSLESSLRSSLGSSLRSSLGSSLESSLWSLLESSLRSSLWSSLRSSLWSSLRSSLGSSLGSSLWSSLGLSLQLSLRSSLGSSLRSSLESSLWSLLESSLRSSLWSSLRSSLRSSLGSSLYDGDYLYGNLNSYWISFYQFCEHIGVKYEPDKAAILDEWETLATHAFHWWPKDGLCVCSHKPTAIYWNKDKTRLHADGRKAVEFSDGWGVYCFDGVRLPDKYGEKKSKDWQSKWILEETNAELKMTLIKGIGYEKMCQDLEAKKVDSWREYELLRIENVDVEPIQLNKMTCPSTGKIHVHRVPPDIKSAREAIKWSNFGIDAESFVVEH